MYFRTALRDPCIKKLSGGRWQYHYTVQFRDAHMHQLWYFYEPHRGWKSVLELSIGTAMSPLVFNLQPQACGKAQCMQKLFHLNVDSQVLVWKGKQGLC